MNIPKTLLMRSIHFLRPAYRKSWPSKFTTPATVFPAMNGKVRFRGNFAHLSHPE
jgi:hypothetical protein